MSGGRWETAAGDSVDIEDAGRAELAPELGQAGVDFTPDACRLDGVNALLSGRLEVPHGELVPVRIEDGHFERPQFACGDTFVPLEVRVDRSRRLLSEQK